MSILDAAGYDYAVFSEVEANPSVATAERCYALYKAVSYTHLDVYKRQVEDLLGGAYLLYETVAHDDDAVAKGHGLGLVVRDVDEGLSLIHIFEGVED